MACASVLTQTTVGGLRVRPVGPPPHPGPPHPRTRCHGWPLPTDQVQRPGHADEEVMLGVNVMLVPKNHQ